MNSYLKRWKKPFIPHDMSPLSPVLCQITWICWCSSLYFCLKEVLLHFKLALRVCAPWRGRTLSQRAWWETRENDVIFEQAESKVICSNDSSYEDKLAEGIWTCLELSPEQNKYEVWRWWESLWSLQGVILVMMPSKMIIMYPICVRNACFVSSCAHSLMHAFPNPNLSQISCPALLSSFQIFRNTTNDGSKMGFERHFILFLCFEPLIKNNDILMH